MGEGNVCVSNGLCCGSALRYLVLRQACILEELLLLCDGQHGCWDTAEQIVECPQPMVQEKIKKPKADSGLIATNGSTEWGSPPLFFWVGAHLSCLSKNGLVNAFIEKFSFVHAQPEAQIFNEEKGVGPLYKKNPIFHAKAYD